MSKKWCLIFMSLAAVLTEGCQDELLLPGSGSGLSWAEIPGESPPFGTQGEFGGGSDPENGWAEAGCGNLPDCPLNTNCNRPSNHQFTDHASMSSSIVEAAAYLYSECAVDGKTDGGLHSNDYITRAEALKVSMYLFGLMFNCNGSNPYADVGTGDWYYPLVLCATKWGVLDTANAYFYPNNDANLVEAAKMLVISAFASGVIQIKNPSSGHFSNIPKSHWGYPYVETLYYYGALNSNQTGYPPDRKVKRGEYALMAAALSPCYCNNVVCASGCYCDQDLHACVNNSGTNNNSSGDNNSNPASGSGNPGSGSPSYTPPPSVGSEGINITMACFPDLSSVSCQAGNTVFSVTCFLNNLGGSALNISSLPMSILKPEDQALCHVTQQNQSSTYVGAHTGTYLNGPYVISCTDIPTDHVFEISFDAVIGGQTYNDLVEDYIDVSDPVFDSCFTPPPQQTPSGGPTGGWICDPNVGYVVYLHSPGALVEALAAGSGDSFEDEPDAGLGVHITFNCADLPGVMRITAVRDILLYTVNPNIPPFAVWQNYSGPLTTDPPTPPQVITDYFLGAAQTVLIRIPALD